MSNAPESKCLAPNGGLPTGNGWDKSQLVEYTRTDIHDTAMARIAELEAALQNVMGNVDTPIARRRLSITGPQPEWLTTARAALKVKP
mgnify:CR=1 FL=1